MKKIYTIGLFFLLLMACSSPEEQQAVLLTQAEQQAQCIKRALERDDVDSIVAFTQQRAPIIHFIYEHGRVAYWSSNALNITHLPKIDYGHWNTFDFDNATAQILWTRAEPYNILSVVPTEWHIHGLEEIENSFSYQPIRDYQKRTSWWQSSHVRVRLYFSILFGLCVLVLGTSFWMLIRARGFKNLRLRHKIQLILSLVVLFVFIYLGASFMRFEREHHEEQQRAKLQDKCHYLQDALKQQYFHQWNLSPGETPVLNVDLRALGYVYGTDIHVYDFNGFLVGSSTPGLFEQGLLNPIMDPEVRFSENTTQVKYEQIGSVRYLAAFTEFINGENRPIGYVVMPFFISEDEVAQDVDNVLSRLLPPFIVMFILTLIISFWIARLITLPIQSLIDKMQHFSLGKDNHIKYKYHDEFGELVQHYNVMVDELETTTRRLLHSEREGAWRTMARQIAHEINNPLTPMKLTVQQLQRLRGKEGFEEKFEQASQMLVEQIDTLSRIATSFSTFAKLPQVVTSEVDIAEKLSQAICLQQNNADHISIRYVGADSGIIALADREQIGQVFTNLLKNALQALEHHSNGDIIVILKDLDKEVEISISDNGPGIPEDIQPKVFMPNFTTKSTGTGLGLAISKNIVEGSDGRITFKTSEKGTTFYIYLQKVLKAYQTKY